MSTATLRRSGGSLIVTIPQLYVEQNHLHAGSKIQLATQGEELKLRPARARYCLDDLLQQTPAGLNRVEGWDEMPSVGAEV